MTERQEHILRVLADPCSAPNGLRGGDRDAIQAAIDEVVRLRAEVERLGRYEANLMLLAREQYDAWRLSPP